MIFYYFFVSWPFIHPLEHNYTGQPAQFNFFNLSKSSLPSKIEMIINTTSITFSIMNFICREVSLTAVESAVSVI